MEQNMNSRRAAQWAAVLAGVIAAAGASAGVLDVSINTSSLAGQSGSEFFLELIGGGSDGGIGYNTVTTSPFALGGGTAGAVDTVDSFGNYSGSMTSMSGVSLNDNGSASNLFAQYLTPGSTLSFQMDLSTNVNTGMVPDGLFMFIYGPGPAYAPLATTSDPSGDDSLLEIEFNSPTPAVTNYAPAGVLTVTPVATAVPEADSLSAMSAGTLLLGALAALRGRRRASRNLVAQLS
jgi:hypothetical protein